MFVSLFSSPHGGLPLAFCGRSKALPSRRQAKLHHLEWRSGQRDAVGGWVMVSGFWGVWCWVGFGFCWFGWFVWFGEFWELVLLVGCLLLLVGRWSWLVDVGVSLICFWFLFSFCACCLVVFTLFVCCFCFDSSFCRPFEVVCSICKGLDQWSFTSYALIVGWYLVVRLQRACSWVLIRHCS